MSSLPSLMRMIGKKEGYPNMMRFTLIVQTHHSEKIAVLKYSIFWTAHFVKKQVIK